MKNYDMKNYMMKKNKYIFGIFLLILGSHILFAQYQWPVVPFNQQHPINATLGEYREAARFHKGIDIGGANANADDPVYPVVSGRVTGIGDQWVVVRSGRRLYRYFHIIPLVQWNDSVTAGVTILGRIRPQDNHLHFEEGRDLDGNLRTLEVHSNPLRQNGLDPRATQAIPPVVYAPEFRREGTFGDNAVYYTNRVNNRILIYGKVDIITEARERFDQQNGGSDRCGVYRMDYKIIDEMRNLNFGPFESFRFDSLYDVDPVPEVYAQDPDRWTNGPYEPGENTYYYVSTFHNAGNFRYWNTKQRLNSTPDVNARINNEAIYRDGYYIVWVRAWNIQGVGGDTINRIL
jgi:hypothetical protein